MTFAADKNSAEFGGMKLFVEEYSVSRSAAVGETGLNSGAVCLFNGGAKAVRIKLSGTSEQSCMDILDKLLRNGTKLTLVYAGMVFEDVFLTDYRCDGKSGSSEKVTVEFAGSTNVAEKEGGTE
ncbi:MAG: hypothetical protein K2J73_12250 [Oscillospiraceae bacterium]|nr:hypothetical protein [Oscillospiraceae bacterium]